jgi:hypothetical protein
MKVTASGPSRHGFSLSLWPSLLFGFLAIKAVLSLVLGLGDKLAPYGTSIYFLLLLLATGFAFRNAVERTQGRRVFGCSSRSVMDYGRSTNGFMCTTWFCGTLTFQIVRLLIRHGFFTSCR